MIDFLKTDTIFKKISHLKGSNFTKYFFPQAMKDEKNVESDDDEDEDETASAKNNGKMSAYGETTTIETSSRLSSSKNRDLAVKLREIERILKLRL